MKVFQRYFSPESGHDEDKSIVVWESFSWRKFIKTNSVAIVVLMAGGFAGLGVGSVASGVPIESTFDTSIHYTPQQSQAVGIGISLGIVGSLLPSLLVASGYAERNRRI